MGSITAHYLEDAEGECAMSDYQNVCSHGKNPAISERQRRAVWYAFRWLTYGLMLGIMIWVAWDQGIIAMYVGALRDLSVAIGNMLRDLTAACWDFIQAISRQWKH